MSQADANRGSYRGVRVLVLGAAGFVGRWVARGLSASGADVHLGVRDRAKMIGLLDGYSIAGTIHEVDVCRDEQIAALLSSVRPGITFNLAGYGVDRSERDEAAAFQINDRLLGVLTEAIGRVRCADWSGRDIVHVGSALEYGLASGDLAESTPAKPTTLYGRSKLAGTRRLAESCAAHNVRGLTARLFTVFGPGEHAGRLLPALLDTARKGAEPLALSCGTQKRDFGYVEDIAEGLLRLGLTTGSENTVNLATGCLATVREFAETAARMLGIPEERLQYGALSVRSEEMNHDPVCVARLRRLVSWVPPGDLERGIRRAWGFESTLRRA